MSCRQLSEIHLPGSPVKSSHCVRLCTSGLQSGGQGVVENVVTGLTTESTHPLILSIKMSWQAQICCIFPPSMNGKMTSLHFSFASSLMCLWQQLRCGCCLSCRYSALVLQLRCLSPSKWHWYFDVGVKSAVL